MNFLGDYAAGGTIHGHFPTRRFTTGAPFALASGALRVLKDGSDVEDDSGITLTADFNSVTGLNYFAIDTSADATFYSANGQFTIYLSAGTVDSVSVVGQPVGRFTLRSPLTAAQVNAEVLDVLNVDTFAEPSGAPTATTTLAGKIGRLYEALRNKVTVTATAKTFYDDAGASLWSKTLSDDGTTYTEAEGA